MDEVEALPVPASEPALPLYKAVEIRRPGASHQWKLMKLIEDEIRDPKTGEWVKTYDYENYGFYHSQDAAIRVLLRMENWDAYCAEAEQRRAA